MDAKSYLLDLNDMGSEDVEDKEQDGNNNTYLQRVRHDTLRFAK